MDFLEFQKSMRESNQVMDEALKYSVMILRRAKELPLDQRKIMIDMVKKLISVNGEDRSIDIQ